MKKIIASFVVIAALFSSQGWAELLNNYDCISVNQDPQYMQELMSSGQYRQANKLTAQQLPTFDFNTSSSFAQYLAYAQKQVALKKPLAELPCPITTPTSERLKLQGANNKLTQVKHLVAPFELKQKLSENNNNAIVLIHGLTDSPFLFHDLAEHFYRQGFTVRTLLLPGHGTAPSDLIDVSYKDWQQAADYIIERTLLDFEEVYLGGFSTGGALIFNHLMQQQQVNAKIKGLIMWSPASKAKSDMAWLAKYLNAIPFMDWVDKDADTDFAKYESFPLNAGAQVHKLMSKIIGDKARKSNQAHNIPLLVVASEHDQTIDTASTLALMNFWQTGQTDTTTPMRLMYFGDANKAKNKLAKQIDVIVPSCQQELCQQVINIAHTATTNAPSNPHYGKQGAYRNCGHYLNDEEKYYACKTGDNVIYGEITPENLQLAQPLQRLTYNPYYEEMLLTITDFLNDIEKH